LIVIDIACRAHHHAVAHIHPVHIGADGVWREAFYRIGGAQDGTANGLFFKGCFLEQIKHIIIWRIMTGANFL
jgi:hypothetical protein